MKVAIRQVRAESSDCGSRVVAEVDGSSVYFESADVELSPSVEAFVSAFLIPALHSSRPLEAEQGVCPTWRKNVEGVFPVVKEWWGLPRLEVQGPDRELAATPSRGVGQCFSGGVDSFYSLLEGGQRPDKLVFVHGFDIEADDLVRVKSYEPILRAAAAERGCEALIVRTNLREHPLFAKTSWKRTHGGALASVGHLLSREISQLVIPASFPHAYPRPWGSSWRLDPHWGSELLELVHDGAEKWRFEKLERIADNPLVQSSLRVCWENLADTPNCSRCEKCVRTMTNLHQLGKLEAYSCFDRSRTLAAQIDSLPALPEYRIGFYRNFIERGGLDAEVRTALVDIVARSERAARAEPWRRLRKRVKHGARTLAQRFRSA